MAGPGWEDLITVDDSGNETLHHNLLLTELNQHPFNSPIDFDILSLVLVQSFRSLMMNKSSRGLELYLGSGAMGDGKASSVIVFSSLVTPNNVSEMRLVLN